MGGGWQMRNIYLYLVCFVTLMMIVFGLAAFLNNAARLAFPLDYRYYITLMDLEAEFVNAGKEVPSLEELRSLQQERMDAVEARERAYLLRDLISSLTVWLVALPFYLFHWKKVKREVLNSGGGIAHED